MFEVGLLQRRVPKKCDVAAVVVVAMVAMFEGTKWEMMNYIYVVSDGVCVTVSIEWPILLLICMSIIGWLVCCFVTFILWTLWQNILFLHFHIFWFFLKHSWYSNKNKTQINCPWHFYIDDKLIPDLL
jgi:hypothetical protein